jgi:hypothetical protein
MTDTDTAVDELTSVEQRVTPTDADQLERALAGDPEALVAVRRRREAVEHIVRARALLRDVDA